MNKLCFISILFCASINGFATNYYFSSTGNNTNSGTSSASPWLTLNKLSTITLKSGDAILLNRGDTFTGGITILQSGTSGNPIVFDAYGMGAKPVITGFVTVSAWTSLGGGIYESTSAVSTLSTLNMVTLNGAPVALGRYPKFGAINKGYLTYQSGTNGSITSNAISGATSFVGGELVVRLDNYVTDRCIITAQTATKITYTPQSGFTPNANFGFFFENHPSTLTQPGTTLGEWYYDPSTKKIRMYFGAANPSSYAIQISAANNVVTASSKNYITFNNISVQGGNNAGIFISSGTSVSVRNCDILYNGVYGITAAGTTSLNVSSNYIDWSNTAGIDAKYQSGGITCYGNTVNHTAMFAGMMWKKNNDDVVQAIACNTANSTIRRNIVIASGYNGIRCNLSNNTIIDSNYVDSTCLVKDDGGGIYTWTGSSTTISNFKILNNVVLNSIGAPEGSSSATSSSAQGIYLDDNSNHVEVAYNTVSKASRGIFLHNNTFSNVHHNTVYDCALGLRTTTDISGKNVNLTIKNNIFFALSSTQFPASFKDYLSNSFSLGTIDNNYYCRPIREPAGINSTSSTAGGVIESAPAGGTRYYSIDTWKSTYPTYDVHSNKTSGIITDVNKIRFEYNPTNASKNLNLGNSYIGVAGTSYSGSITLPPYSSIILLLSGAQNIAPTASITSPAVNATFNAPASIIISASAADADGSVSKVEFNNGNTLLGSDNTAPYSFSWSNVAAGSYTLTAKATDNSGSSTISSQVVVTVNAVTSAPTVSITSPAANSTFNAPASIIISASAADADGSVSKVEFYNGNTLLGSGNTAPYSFSWSNVAAGSYTLTAKATDNSGASTISSQVGVTVKAVNIAPTVSLTSPVANQTYGAPASIKISANATDPDGSISKVEFYSGNTLVTTEKKLPYSWTWNNVPTGNYKITAKAYDNSGASTISSPVSVVVSGQNISPTVSLTSPVTNQTYGAPASIRITANATDPDGSISKVEFYGGNTLITTEKILPYSWTWNNVPTGNYKITAKAYDNSGASTISSPIPVVVSAQNISPTVSLTSPVANQTYGVPASIKISANANDPDGSISKVEFYSGNTLITTEKILPYSWTWNNVPAGNYKITAKAYDNSGASTVSSPVSIVVSVQNLSSTNNASSANELEALPNNLEPLNITIGPNPASTTISVFIQGFQKNKELKISILTINGNLVRTINSNTSNPVIQVDVSSLTSGTYLLELLSGDKKLYKQFVKQ